MAKTEDVLTPTDDAGTLFNSTYDERESSPTFDCYVVSQNSLIDSILLYFLFDSEKLYEDDDVT